MGFSVTDAGLLCASESWALSDVIFLRLPRKSEIATSWREVEGGRRSERGRSKGSGARRERGEGG